jgi:uncharacterized protein DUF29
MAKDKPPAQPGMIERIEARTDRGSTDVAADERRLVDLKGADDVTVYDTDILIWAESQAELLRRVGTGEPINDQIDWENVAEEIESVGRSELHAVESLLVQAMLQGLKSDAWPTMSYVPDWEAEARGFRDDAAHRFTASMRQRIDVADLYARALRRMPETIDGLPPLPVPAECPVTLDELLAADP